MKQTIKENYRVVITPTTDARLIAECGMEEICSDIMDDVLNEVGLVGEVWKEHDTREICFYCRKPWAEVQTQTKALPKGKPLCCMMAVKKWEELQKEMRT